ncbi:hypothetical protein HN803_04230 [candidate division WWE3 bacterium]|jgi:hypothetical protein|nr:hypothetical protein [candidate division WWE3 bacterium]
MAINLDKINAALDRLDPEKRSQTGNSNNDDVVKLPEGQTTLRLVPYKYDEEMPFREFHFHYGVAGKTFLCPSRMKQEPCEICELATKMWRTYESTQDETYKDAFKKLVATLRVFIPVVVRGEEDKGVRWWGVNPRSTYKEILTAIKNAAQQGIDILDPESGRDLVVTVEKGWNDYLIPKSVQPAFADSKLAKTKKAQDELLETVTNIDEKYTYRANEEMSAALSGFFATNDVKEGTETGTTKNYSNGNSEPDEEDLIDFGGKDETSVEESVSDKFDKVVNK